MKEDVDVVLLVDETFLRCRETTNKDLAPKAVKCVGVALSVNEINGWSVMITLDMFTNIALPLFIIFTGVFSCYINKWV